MFMCKGHWSLLPKEMQSAVWKNYVIGQEVRKDPTDEYLRVTQECIDWIYKEGIRRKAELDEKKARR